MRSSGLRKPTRLREGQKLASLCLTRLLLGFFESLEEGVHGLQLGRENCPTLGDISKALF
jgi:hypothetical protein